MNNFFAQKDNFKQGLYEIILEALEKCSDLMKQTCVTKGITVENHEEKIRNHLLENYLENDEVRARIGLSGVRFIPEALVNYNTYRDTYIGRVDIQVFSTNCFGKNKNDYYIIECKRIDGSTRLNSLYVEKGICRFIETPIKYPSFHKKNILFAFVVKNIDIAQNILKITNIHQERLGKITNKNLTHLRSDIDKGFFLYESDYLVDDGNFYLSHIFYDFSPIIENHS